MWRSYQGETQVTKSQVRPNPLFTSHITSRLKGVGKRWTGKSKGQNSWQQVKYAWIYSDLKAKLKGDTFTALGSKPKQRGFHFYMWSTPQHVMSLLNIMSFFHLVDNFAKWNLTQSIIQSAVNSISEQINPFKHQSSM